MTPTGVVFGMVGNVFVVGSDRASVKRIATQSTRPVTRQPASVTRVPLEVVSGGHRDFEAIAARLFGTLELSADSGRGRHRPARRTARQAPLSPRRA